MILDSIAMTTNNSDKNSISGTFVVNNDKSNGNESMIKELNEQVVNTSELINAVIYIDDEDDLGSPTADETKIQWL